MKDNVTNFIENKKKKKKKKKVILTAILLIIISLLVVFKTPIFKIKIINITGNDMINSNEIIKLSKVSDKDNIFCISTKNIEKNIKINPYISNVDVKRQFPNKLNISIEEKPAAFYIMYGDKCYILNDELRVLEKTDKLNKNNLLEIKGLKVADTNVGGEITKNNKQIDISKELYKIIKYNKSNIKFNLVDISNQYNIILYSNNVAIKLGNKEDLVEKINQAINILNDKKINLEKGYIDLSFKGNPVIKEEK